MDPLTIGLIALALLLIMVLAGVHIGISLMTISMVGIYLATSNINIAINILGTTAFQAIRTYTFGVIPLFVLMGLLANLSGASTELFAAANEMLRKLKGGLAIATVGSNAVFAAITGVSVASAAVFTKIALPSMMAFGYKRSFAVGTIAGSSVLGMLIPPSILMIVYGMLTEVSVGKMFIAGVLPGILLSALYVILILILVRVDKKIIGNEGENVEEHKIRESWRIILRPWPMILLIVLTLGGIWGGFFTPIEAGGIGAFGAFLLVIFKRKLTWGNMKNVLLETGLTTGSIFFLLTSAQMYSRMLAISGVVSSIGNAIGRMDVHPLIIICLFTVVFIFLGCILDSTSILLLTIPLMFPIITGFGYDGVWFGILAIVAIETGLLTPPFGLSVYTIKSSLSGKEEYLIGGRPLELAEIFKGSMSYLVIMFLLIVLLIAFPEIATVLVP